MRLIFILTIWLFGIPIWSEPTPYMDETLCKADGRQKVADYRREHLMVRYSCDPQ